MKDERPHERPKTKRDYNDERPQYTVCVRQCTCTVCISHVAVVLK